MEQPVLSPPIVPVRLVHIARADTGYEFAYCGKRRDRELDPDVEGERCVVCQSMHDARANGELVEDAA